MKVLAMDMGGTFIKYGICEISKTGNIKFLIKNRFQTPYKDVPYGTIVIENMAKFAAHIIKDHPEIKCICSSIGGVIDDENFRVLSPHHKFQNYAMMDIKHIFNKHCKLPLHIINDVKAGALGELRYGSLKGKKSAVFLAIGTGIASCAIINGKLYLGHQFASGECGPMVVNNHYYENHYGLPPLIKRCQEIDDTIVTAEDCLMKMSKNTSIKNIMDAWFVGLVEGIVTFLYLFNPEYFVFGGKITEHKYFDLNIFHSLMKSNVRQPPMPNIVNVKLIKASLGNDAALYGAASLAWNKDFKL